MNRHKFPEKIFGSAAYIDNWVSYNLTRFRFGMIGARDLGKTTEEGVALVVKFTGHIGAAFCGIPNESIVESFKRICDARGFSHIMDDKEAAQYMLAAYQRAERDYGKPVPQHIIDAARDASA